MPRSVWSLNLLHKPPHAIANNNKIILTVVHSKVQIEIEAWIVKPLRKHADPPAPSKTQSDPSIDCSIMRNQPET